MYKNNVLNKGWVVIVILLFVGMSMLPVSGSLSIERVSTASQIQKSNLGDDTTPPVTTHSFNGTLGENGYYISDVEVTLNATDDMSGVNVTYYSLDGIINVYSGPFMITGEATHALSYRSIDNAGNVEDWNSVQIFIDLNPPQVDLMYEKIDDVYKLTAYAWDSMSGAERVEFYLDDELVFTDYELPYEWILTLKGTHWINAIAYDRAGYNASDEISLSVSVLSPISIVGLICNPEFSRQNVGPSLLPSTGGIIVEEYVSTASQLYESNSRNDNDTTPPVTTCTLNPPEPNGDNGWYVSDVEVTLNATDNMSGVDITYYRINNGEWETYEVPFVINESNYYVIEYYSVDNEGNVEDVKSASFKVDSVPPVTTAHVSGNDIWFTATDDMSGVNWIEFRIDGGSVQIGTSVIFVVDGTHQVDFHSIDVAGNVEPWKSITVTIDYTPPTIEITWEVHGNFIQGWYVTFFVTCYDEISGIDILEIYLDDVLLFTDNSEPYECMITFRWSSALKNSIFKACASDSAGNLGCETVHLSEINPYSNSQSSSSQQSTNPLFFQILERLLGYQ